MIFAFERFELPNDREVGLLDDIRGVQSLSDSPVEHAFREQSQVGAAELKEFANRLTVTLAGSSKQDFWGG